jgi:hypothetical protein
MSHFAKIENGIVITVNSAEQDNIDTQEGTWVQTSYNTHGNEHPLDMPMRGNFAGIGYTYDESRDAFYTPQPYPSWTLNETTCIWECPEPYPDDGEHYKWNEETLSWDEE